MKDVVKDFSAGTMAGMSAKYVEYPLDTIKVRLQDSRSRYTSSANCFARMLKDEGVLSFYRGVTAPLCGCMLETAIAFTTYGRFLALFERRRKLRGDQLRRIDNFFSGCIAGIFLAPILTPIELIKCRLQIQEMLPVSQRLYYGTRHCALHILRNDGMRGIFVGLMPCFLREIPGNGVWYGVYETIKAYLLQGKSVDDGTCMYRVACAGAFAGVAYWSAFFPADVVKTRKQVEVKYQQHTFFRVLQTLYLEGGFRALYKGWGITVARAIPAHAALFVTYESFKKALDSAF